MPAQKPPRRNFAVSVSFALITTHQDFEDVPFPDLLAAARARLDQIEEGYRAACGKRDARYERDAFDSFDGFCVERDQGNGATCTCPDCYRGDDGDD
jgi:hypothetical protein